MAFRFDYELSCSAQAEDGPHIFTVVAEAEEAAEAADGLHPRPAEGGFTFVTAPVCPVCGATDGFSGSVVPGTVEAI